jgi:hypothetical protein
MRIFGGHDYYDSAMSLGIDKTITLFRKNDEIPEKSVHIPGYQLRFTQENRWTAGRMNQITVVFGPRIYHGIEVKADWGEAPVYIWDAERLRQWVDSQKRKYSFDIIRPWKESWKSKKEIPIEGYFMTQDSPDSVREFMITNRYAILLKVEYDRETRMWMNPYNLKKYGFMKALDPFSAFQELSMWVGGVLCGQSPSIVEITDDITILEGHGFDKKISFRGPQIK